MKILTDDKGQPFERPEPPGPNATIEEKIAFLRAFAAYKDAVANSANRAFTRSLRQSLR